MAEQSWEPHRVSQQTLDIARDLELCFAAAAACHLWTHGQGGPDDGRWLAGALAVIEEKLPCRAGAAHGDAFEALADRLLTATGGPLPTLAGMAPL